MYVNWHIEETTKVQPRYQIYWTKG